MTTKNKKSEIININYKFGLIVGILLFLAAVPALASAASTTGISHPSLMFDDISEVPGYQYRTESPWNSWESYILQTADSYLTFDFSDPQWPTYDRILYRAAFTRDLGLGYQITKDEKYAEKTREALLNIGLGSQSSWERAKAVRDYSLAYDWVQPYLNDTDDRVIRNKLAELANIAYLDLNENGANRDYVTFSDYHGQAYPSIAVAGLVLEDFTNPDNIPLQSSPEDWKKTGTDYLFINDELHSYNKPLIEFGFDSESGKNYLGAYKSYVIADLLWWFQIYSHYYDRNIFDDYPVSKKIVTSEIWETLPNGYMNNAVTSGNTLVTYHSGILNLLDDGEKAEVMNYLDKTEGNNLLPYSYENDEMPYIYFYMVYGNYKNIAPSPPTWTDHLSPDASYQVFRENWETDSDWLSLMTFNGKTNSNRDSAHHDQLSIEYYGEGNLLLADAGENKYVLDTHYGPYGFQHNSIAIENPAAPYPVSSWSDSESRGVYKGNFLGVYTPVTVENIVQTPWTDMLTARETINHVIGDEWSDPYVLASPVDYSRTIIHNDNDYFVLFDRLEGNSELVYRNVFRPASLDITPTRDLNGDYAYSESETGHVNGNLKLGGTAYDWLSLPYKTETNTGIETNSVIWDTKNPYGNNVHMNLFSVPASEVILTKQVGRIAGYSKESEVFSPTLYLREEPSEDLYRITALLSDYAYEEQKTAEEVIVNGSGSALKVTSPKGEDYFYSGDLVSSFDRFETDADIAYIRYNNPALDYRLTLIKGSYLNAEGQKFIEISGTEVVTLNRNANSATIVTDGTLAGDIILYQIGNSVSGITKDGIVYGDWGLSGDNSYLRIGLDSGKHEYRITFSGEVLPEQKIPVADFTADVRAGELPLEIHFSDTSLNTPSIWQWNFGDGETSFEQNPVHIYNESGNYTVTLKVSNADGNDTEVKADYISVLLSPAATVPPGESSLDADFTADVTTGSAPLTVKYTDISTGQPEHWTYYFGDGETIYAQNPEHAYVNPGTYTVTLRVLKDGGNEMDYEEKKGFITVTEAVPVPVPVLPVADFTADITEAEAGTEIRFTDISSENPVSWQWSFGDGNISGEQNPVHIYSKAGIYTVTLEVINADGTDEEVKTDYINVLPVPVAPEEVLNADFTADVTTGSAPLTVKFTDISTGQPEHWTYYFGDGETIYAQNPEHTYVNPGTYTVTLRVLKDGGNEMDYEEKKGFITVTEAEAEPEPVAVLPVADFTADITEAEAGTEIRFTDISSENPVSWQWSFGDGVISGEQNPVHIYSKAGIYTVTLEVINADGTDDEVKTDYINVLPVPVAPEEVLNADFTADVTTGSAPLTVKFTDISTGQPEHWTYYFGDGGAAYEQNAEHTYTESGTYTVTLRVIKDGGNEMDYEEKKGLITVTEAETVPVLPVADFTADITEAEAGTEIRFTDISSENPVSWQWSFGDGVISGEQNPVHIYSEAGIYTVTLEVINADGTDDEVKTDYINVLPVPVAPEEVLNADFTADVTFGSDPLAVQFADISTGSPETWVYSFGDGKAAYEQNPVHTYANPGKYTVMLLITKSNGLERDSEKKIEYITVNDEPLPPVAGFTADIMEAEAGTEIRFTDTSKNFPVKWLWSFGDGSTSVEKNPVYTYANAGEYTVTLEVSNADGTDTEIKADYINVFSAPAVTEPPVEEVIDADFTADFTTGSAPLEVSFTDLSLGEPDNWVYSFGDGDTAYDKNPVHIYTEPGTYSVTLSILKDGVNITDFEEKAGFITVTEPVPVLPSADFSADITEAEAGTGIRFTYTGTENPLSWKWNFGDEGTSVEQNPVYIYDNPGKYSVSLEVANDNGTDTEVKTDYITVLSSAEPEPPVEEVLNAEFLADVTTGSAPLEVLFTDKSTGSPETWVYSFGDGKTAYEKSPVHTYIKPGKYNVMLRVTKENGKEKDTEKKMMYIVVT
ncbi:PKD domain-containing protein [Methanoplanus limicola]|uniref:PKD domain containing protein n=1 Tax=Methanoplanus limicola DSM 2279 TaxID=937775 RepID=H1YZR4_9EURY|nr:PKD domain-containing protein [Methanoplanus limicola]EHQ34326.1 PKD domain containing protein [Methanoplanus limicola DSM 2279]